VRHVSHKYILYDIYMCYNMNLMGTSVLYTFDCLHIGLMNASHKHIYIIHLLYQAHLEASWLLKNEICHTFAWAILHMNVYHSTGWQRLIGSPLSCRSFSTKGKNKIPINISHFCGKWPINIRDPMSLRHPVQWSRVAAFQKVGSIFISLLYSFDTARSEQQYFTGVFCWI